MRIHVNKKELKSVSEDLQKSSMSVNDEIELWVKEHDKLKAIWSGHDADVYFSKIDQYLLKLKMISETSSELGKFIEKAHNKYTEEDSEFAQELRKENDQYDYKQLDEFKPVDEFVPVDEFTIPDNSNN